MSPHKRKQRPTDRDSEAADWVARCDAGLSEAERREFEHWRDAAPENVASFNRLTSTWNSLGRPLRAGASASLLEELDALRRRDRRRRVQAASVAAMLLCVTVSAWWIRSDMDATGELPANTVLILPERQVLSDGSILEYARGTEFEISYSSAARRVVLKKGDAHFQVTGNAARPFVVSVNGIDVQAVGTAFGVQARDTTVDVVVTEGRVAVDQGASGSPTNLALVDQGSGVSVELASEPAAAPSVTPISALAQTQRLAWRVRRVDFSGVAMVDVVAVLNRYGSSTLVIDDPQIREVLLSGLFQADDTESFLNTLETGFGIVAEKRGKVILLRGAK